MTAAVCLVVPLLAPLVIVAALSLEVWRRRRGAR